jgi:hypothetical protein
MFPKSHRQHQFTLQIRMRGSRILRLSWSSRPFMQPAASKMLASNSSAVSTFLLQSSLFIKIHKYNSNWSFVRRFKQLYVGNHSEIDTCVYENFFLTMPDTVTSHNTDLSSWITLYIKFLVQQCRITDFGTVLGFWGVNILVIAVRGSFLIVVLQHKKSKLPVNSMLLDVQKIVSHWWPSQVIFLGGQRTRDSEPQGS